jgi:hypothetical protein
MKTIEKITWLFINPTPELRCMICGKPADKLVKIDLPDFPDMFRIPACPDCGKLDEAELIKRIKAN